MCSPFYEDPTRIARVLIARPAPFRPDWYGRREEETTILKNDTLKIDAAIFDLDGTLIDSIAAYVELAEEMFRRLHLPPVSGKVILERIRDTKDNWANLFAVEEMREGLMEEAAAIYKEISPRLFTADVKMLPGSGSTLRKLSAAGISIGLVTSTHSRSMDGKLYPLRENGLMELIGATIAIEDTQRIKPHPDPLIECAKRLGVSPERSIYVGDSHSDIRAGKSAGMKAIGVLTGMDNYETLKREDPYMIIDSVAHLSRAVHY
ncbi:HAD hydrolase, family IA, variant 3 [delta proteobacterium NaphS2]|nr:HAD hydrolase, family IA, variant 3 [delta proteobacterium NaphS2]